MVSEYSTGRYVVLWDRFLLFYKDSIQSNPRTINKNSYWSI